MIKTELSIGDWVKVPGLVYDNGLEDFDNGMCKVRRLGDGDLDVYAFEELSYSEVEPIMITKSILERFGFVEKEAVKEVNIFEYRTDDLLAVYSMNYARVDIRYYKINESNTDENGDSNIMEFDLSANVLYVHQLQHLFRIVGKEFNEIELIGIYEV